MILAWSVVAIFLVVDVVWLQLGRLTFAPGTFVRILWAVAIVVAAYFATIAIAHRLRSDQSMLGRRITVVAEGTGLLLQAAAFIVASGITGVTFSYLSASLGLPLRDAELAAIDKAIGFDWPAFLAFTNQYHILSWALRAVYHAAGPQLVLLLLFLSFTRQHERLATFLAVLALSDLMTGIVVTLVPAEGAYAYYQPARSLFSQFSPDAGVWHRQVFAALRNDAAPILDFTRAQGLVTFPSFHTTLAIITAWAVRDVRYIAIPAMLLNAAVIVSTLPEGGHHLIDLFAGGTIAAIAILTVQIYTRQSNSEHPQVANPGTAFVLDWAARIAIVAVFTGIAVLNLAAIYQMTPIDGPQKLLAIAARLANCMFVILIAATALTRLSPVLKAKGIEPRVSALLGTFLCTGLAVLPKAELGPVLSIISTMLIMIGSVLSFIVLRWLGRSFSILAEARWLVTAGPYGVVRHPLYLCEGIALLGIALQVISPLAVVLSFVIGLLQFRRMINEEAVLNSAFSDYRAYATRIPRVIPARVAALYLGSTAIKDDTSSP